MIDLLNSILQLIFDAIDWGIEPFLDPLASIGISEPVLQSMLISAALALSIYITLYGGMFSLANAGFMAIGAYIGAILTTRYDYQFGVTILIGMSLAGLIALSIGLPVLRLRNIYLAIATIGFGEIVVVFINNFDDILWNLRTNSDAFGSIADGIYDLLNVEIEVSDAGRERKPRITFGARGISNIPKNTQTAHLIFFLVIICYVMYRINRSRFGRALASIRQDEKVAASQGINVVYYKNAAFLIGALIAGAAGVFDSHRTSTTIANNFGFNQAVNILAYAVLGGIGSWIGPLIGGITLKGLPELLRELQEYSGLITGIILLTTIVYLPGGISSLLRRDFWTMDGKFRMAQRIGIAGVVIIIIANVLPFQGVDSVSGRILGNEFLQDQARSMPFLFFFLALALIGSRYYIHYREGIRHQDQRFQIPHNEQGTLIWISVVAVGLFILAEASIVSKNLWALLMGNLLPVIAIFWLLHQPQREEGGRYSEPLAIIAGGSAIVWLILVVAGVIDRVMIAYYFQLIGLIVLTAACLIQYPPSALHDEEG